MLGIYWVRYVTLEYSLYRVHNLGEVKEHCTTNHLLLVPAYFNKENYLCSYDYVGCRKASKAGES